MSYLHEWHINGTIFDPAPLGPWGGAKMSNIIRSQLQSRFQRFLNQTVCVFSQMKDIRHIRQDFYSVAWVMPQTWRYHGGLWGSIFCCEIQPDLVRELLT